LQDATSESAYPAHFSLANAEEKWAEVDFDFKGHRKVSSSQKASGMTIPLEARKIKACVSDG
jgi:hypothetical protein